jgi:trehalose-phosphatase
VIEGKRVLELVPAGLPDKGSAVSKLARERGLRGIVFIGDDFSDVAVFREITRRREEEGLPGLGIAVVDAETEEAVREAADAELAGVDEVEEFLAALAQALAKGGTP